MSVEAQSAMVAVVRLPWQVAGGSRGEGAGFRAMRAFSEGELRRDVLRSGSPAVVEEEKGGLYHVRLIFLLILYRFQVGGLLSITALKTRVACQN